MALIVDMTFSGDRVFFADTFEMQPDAIWSLAEYHYDTDADDHIHYVFFWWIRGVAPDVIDRTLAETHVIDTFSQVVEGDDRHLYRMTTMTFPPEKPRVFPLFREYDVTTENVTRDSDGFHFRTRFPSREALQAFLDERPVIAEAAEITRLHTHDGASPTDVLTDKQREALTLAADAGYFETPAEVTLEELAETVDVTPQTLSSHIRAGVRKVVEDALSSNSH